VLRLLARDAGPHGRAVLAALVLLVGGVVVGMAVLWPGGGDRIVSMPATVEGGAGQPVKEVAAEVEGTVRRACRQSRSPCQILTIRIAEGAESGRRARLTLPGTDLAAEVLPGDRIRVVKSYVPPGAEPPPNLEAYSFSDFERRSPLLILAIVFAVLVVALGRWKGVRSLLGLAASLAVVTQFMVPAILDGSSPLAVALVGALAVMLLTVGLAHGTGVTSLAAVLGSAASLLATALLAVLFVGLAHITGFSSEEATLLLATSEGGAGGGLSLEGLVLAGIVVGALGVLDDVTVSQASTVLALRRANPALGGRAVFREGLSVGRDHLSATVNTLVLAYVGAALPVLLIFEQSGTRVADALNRERVAGQVVAMLVGSIGLVLAVPLTTALAAWLARTLPPAALAHAGDGHAHHHH